MTPQQASVVATGAGWLGSGIGSIETALEDIFDQARRDILLTVYSIGAVDRLIVWLETALTRGIAVTLVINALDDQPREASTALRHLATAYPHFRLYQFIPSEGVDLHAKAVVADHSAALIGSSNLSRRGLLTNHELALLVRGSVASDIAEAIERLVSSRYVARVRG